jgi:hypothetical protein
MNVEFFYILSISIIWDRLSQKTISRYCPFNTEMLCDDQNREDGNKAGTEIDHGSHRKKMSKKNV